MSPLRAKGIGRDFENEQTLFVSFNRRPTDDELRALHDLLRDMAEDVPATSRASGDAYMIRRHHPTSEVCHNEPTQEMVAAACAAFDKVAHTEGWKCKTKHKATFIRWMRYALCAALEARKEQTHE